MQLAFHGAAGAVTGSNHLIETDGGILMIDCGMFQGQKELRNRNSLPFSYTPRDVSAVIITHAHIDHSGRLPKLVKEGFRGPVYATPACVELLKILLLDSAHIQSTDCEYENKKRKRKGLAPLEPLYTEEDAEKALGLLKPIDYHREFRALDNVSAVFHDAGHIMGSCFLELSITENGITRTLVGGGDLGRSHQALIGDPEVRDRADMIMIESTYGNRRHKTEEDTNTELIGILKTVVAGKGTLLIPAFAVGRTQEMIYRLFELSESSSIPRMPVYVDSPMAREVTRIYAAHNDLYDQKTLEYVRRGKNPLSNPDIHFVESIEESIRLNTVPGPKIIISASGMCDAGRVLHHLKHNIWKKDCHILIVGFQAEGTLGRRLVDGAKRVTILGDSIQVNAQTHTIGGLSAHADRDEMLAWLKFYRGSQPKVFIVHGDPPASKAFGESIQAELGLECFIPQWHDTANITFTPNGLDISWQQANADTGVQEQRERLAGLCAMIDAHLQGVSAEQDGGSAAFLEKLNIAVNDILEELRNTR
ncbi:MAG: MBL fold metallo-hydrolase [Spirochaetota bacterium]|nr:MBL fold metallo-hydrolase [Spirochaetota bacterium]